MQLKIYYKYFLFLLFLLFSIFYFFKNLGFILDITEKDIPAEIFLCLGGGKGERIEKTIQLYKKYKEKKTIFILTENDKYNLKKKLELLEKVNIPKKQIIIEENVKSTYDELLFTSNYMKKNKLTTLNIISDEPHSRRIKMLIKNFINYESITYSIVGSNVKWWNKRTYYKNKRVAIYYSIRELLKICHNYIYYNISNFFNLDKNTKDNLEEYEQIFLKYINRLITYILKTTS